MRALARLGRTFLDGMNLEWADISDLPVGSGVVAGRREELSIGLNEKAGKYLRSQKFEIDYIALSPQCTAICMFAWSTNALQSKPSMAIIGP
jgi:hypothetical protein